MTLYSTIISLSFLPLLTAARSGSARVLLRDVTALTLRRGEFTNYRRVSPVQQLACVRGCDSRSIPDEIQCTNVGFDGFDTNWKCQANLPMGSKLTNVQVQCEGYDSPDDPYVLAGSCGATYELIQSKYAYLDEDESYDHRQRFYDSSEPIPYDDNGWSWSGLLLTALVGYIFYNIFSNVCSATTAAANPSGSSWGSSNSSGFSPFGGGGFFSGLGLGSMLGSAWGRPRRTGWGSGRSFFGGSNASSGYTGRSYMSGASQSTGRRRETSTSYATTSRR